MTTGPIGSKNIVAIDCGEAYRRPNGLSELDLQFYRDGRVLKEKGEMEMIANGAYILSIIMVVLVLTLHAQEPTFYEGFESREAVVENGGLRNQHGWISFVEGISGNAGDFSGSRAVNFLRDGNFSPLEGTIYFWVKFPNANGLGLFDIGNLGSRNSWGIFKNRDHVIMEVKNRSNYFDQAWSPGPVPYDGEWHFIAAPWERTGSTTYFAVCVDGSCKAAYDGITNHSYPETDGDDDFWIGWCGWYGYSQSMIDEFKVFDYAKSNQEIYEDYLAEVPLEDRTPKPCVREKAMSTGPVVVTCDGLTVHGEPFTVKGVGYQPIPIGFTAESLADKQQMYDDERIFDRDFVLLRRMGVNTIRTWGEVQSELLLDAAWNNGDHPLHVLMGFWIDCRADYSNPVVRQAYKDQFGAYVARFAHHPAVLAWGIGNENNLGYCSPTSQVEHFYSLGEELAKLAYEIEGPDYHPVGIINGDLLYVGLDIFGSEDSDLPHVDFWGSNVYPGESFGTWFTDFAIRSGKPVLITEYGIDALDNRTKEEYQDVQAEYAVSQWGEINAASNTLGASLMAYSDEWWKAGGVGTHDHGGYATDQHPDGYSNEEWWGVVQVSPGSGTGVDAVTPREVYYRLGREFVSLGDMDGNGVLNALDVEALELAVADSAGYRELYPYIDPLISGDMDGSGLVDAFDLDALESALKLSSGTGG